MGGSELQLSRSLSLYAHAARTENLFCGSQAEVHVGEVEAAFALRLQYLLVLGAVEVGKGALLAPLPIFLGSHHYRGCHPRAAHFVAYDVAVERVVILHRLLHVLRPLQVVGALYEVAVLHGRGLLHGPARVEQRVGYLLFLYLHVLHHHPVVLGGVVGSRSKARRGLGHDVQQLPGCA